MSKGAIFCILDEEKLTSVKNYHTRNLLLAQFGQGILVTVVVVKSSGDLPILTFRHFFLSM